jgi:hypothetical protein
MKSEILKIAGVKSEKEFYKKYPTEAAFKKAHPKAFKGVQTKHAISKAQNSASMPDTNGNGIPDYIENPYGLQNQSMGPGLGSNQYIGSNNGQAQLMTFGQNIPSYNNFGLSQPPQDWETPSVIPAGLPQSQPYGMDQYIQANNQAVTGQPITATTAATNKNKGGGQPFNMQGFGNVFTGAVEGFQALKAEKELTKKLETWANVSDVVKKAGISNAFAEKPKRQWFRPDDKRFIHNTGEQYIQQGRGTDVLGQNGSMIGGNPTEVQNTFGIGSSIYKDLEDPDKVKNFQGGGGFGSWFGQANSALSGSGNTSFMGNVGQGSPFDSLIGGSFGNNAGSKIGGSLGSLFGPVGSLAGTAIGGYFDKEPGHQAFQQGRINANNNFLSRLNYANGITGGLNAMHVGENGANLDGGWVSNDWQPQVIATFGEHKVKDLLRPPHDADMLRAGGHLREYTPPSARAMETYENGGEINSYALGGKLKSHWGGRVKDKSHNPYLPGSGMTAMIEGASHKNGGVGISYGDDENDYQGYAANGADMGADIEAENKEPVIEMAENGTKDTKAVVYGNIPLSELMANEFGNETVKRLANKYSGWSMKKIVAERTKDEIKANKNIDKAAKVSNNADDNTKSGQLDQKTAQIIKDSGDTSLQMIADEKTSLADFQDGLQDIKKKLSYIRGKNISAEAIGRGKIKGKPITMKDVLDGKVDDRDPITMYAPIENPYANSDEVAKFGTSLRKAQNSTNVNEPGNHAFPSTGFGPVINNTTEDTTTVVPITTVTPANDSITEDQYNNFIKLYNQSQATKGKANDSTLEFQKLYHQFFPKEALSAIQKTTKENGLSNKAKAMGLTVQDILAGKDIARILQSNEDKYHGPRTDQYMASVRSHFKQTPDLKLTTLGGIPTTTATNTTKPPIGVVPYKGNNIADFANMILPFIQKDNIPPIDPRQFAGEYMALAQNQYEPVPSQHYTTELDPLYRVSYQDVRNASTADFRDALRMNQFNPAAAAAIYGKKAMADQSSFADEFRTNQALEQQIFGGNRAKINQERMANIQLNANQMDKQEMAKSKTKETSQKAIASIADKNMKYDADIMKYKIDRNLFPQFGYDASGRIHNQGPWYKPTIPQIYGGKSTIQQIPVYKDGKLDHYEMVETGKTTTDTTTLPSSATPPFIPGQGYVSKKNGGSVVKNAKNGSVVRGYKNL